MAQARDNSRSGHSLASLIQVQGSLQLSPPTAAAPSPAQSLTKPQLFPRHPARASQAHNPHFQAYLWPLVMRTYLEPLLPLPEHLANEPSPKGTVMSALYGTAVQGADRLPRVRTGAEAEDGYFSRGRLEPTMEQWDKAESRQCANTRRCQHSDGQHCLTQ